VKKIFFLFQAYGVNDMEYGEKMKNAVMGLWANLLEFTRKNEYSIMYWGISYAPWSSGEHAIKLIASYINSEIWNELISLIEKNGLTVKHWSMASRNNEIGILIWVTLKEV
jgi:hypothetical protein